MAETSTLPSFVSYTTTLHGNIVPILSSACRAWYANGGLHAPNIR